MIYLGIDPGASGGIGVVKEFIDGNTDATCHKMPESPRELATLIEGMIFDGRTCFAVLERVSAMPKQGVSSTFKFGTSYGVIQGVLAALEIPYDLVTPTVWQKAMGCLSKGDKNVTKAAALRLFPSLKITHATADAMLLADYCRRTQAARYRVEVD